MTNGAGERRSPNLGETPYGVLAKMACLRFTKFHSDMRTNRSTITPDMTPLTTSGRRISRKDCRKCRLRWLRVTFLQNGLCEAQLFDSLPAAPVLLTFLQYLVAFSSRLGATIGIISSVLSGWFVGPVIPYRRVNCLDPRLNRSGEIQPKAVGCGIFCRFSITSIIADRN